MPQGLLVRAFYYYIQAFRCVSLFMTSFACILRFLAAKPNRPISPHFDFESFNLADYRAYDLEYNIMVASATIRKMARGHFLAN